LGGLVSDSWKLTQAAGSGQRRELGLVDLGHGFRRPPESPDPVRVGVLALEQVGDPLEGLDWSDASEANQHRPTRPAQPISLSLGGVSSSLGAVLSSRKRLGGETRGISTES
jgi:hypothetical protein